MNIIERGKNNVLIFTLEERRTLTDPFYLVKMLSPAQQIKRFILPSNQSTQKKRFDQFTITETDGTETLTSGVITLKPAGFWDYSIYEQLSSTNLNEWSADNTVPLETGIIKVTGGKDSFKYYDSQTKEYKFYGTGST